MYSHVGLLLLVGEGGVSWRVEGGSGRLGVSNLVLSCSHMFCYFIAIESGFPLAYLLCTALSTYYYWWVSGEWGGCPIWCSLVSTSHVTLVSIQSSLLYILISSLLLGDGVEGEVRVSNSALSYGYSKMIFYDFNYNKRFLDLKFYIWFERTLKNI